MKGERPTYGCLRGRLPASSLRQPERDGSGNPLAIPESRHPAILHLQGAINIVTACSLQGVTYTNEFFATRAQRGSAKLIRSAPVLLFAMPVLEFYRAR